MFKHIFLSSMAVALAVVPASAGGVKIKTRLEHLSGTQWVLVVSYLPSEITSVTCDSWTMLGINSWKHQNEFTIPPGPAVAIMDSNKFNGYCTKPDSIKAHTDDGDFVGSLDRGAGNWTDSTKLTFGAP
jgi:hypothetical protein